MRVVLRHAEIGLYYAGHAHWVGNQSDALDLQSIEQAMELSREESFEAMEIMVCYDDPTCELVLPIGRKKSGGEEARRLAS